MKLTVPPSIRLTSKAAFDCWTTHVVFRCVVMLLGLLNALGIIQSAQGQDAAESRFAAPTAEIEISTGSEPEGVVPRSLSSEMASVEASPQIPECVYPGSRIWLHLSEGDSCTSSYQCGARTIPGPYAYIHHVDYTAERGKDVLITGPDSVRIQEGGRVTEYLTDKYEAIPDGIPEGDEEMLCYCSGDRDGPGGWRGHRVQIKDVDGWTVSDATANESHGNMTFLLEFPQPVVRDLTVKYSTKDGTAKGGTDYTRTIGAVTVRKGQMSAYIGVPLVKDQIPEGTETFELLTISDQFSGIPEQKATGTIVEGSHFIIEPSPLFVDEGGQNTYTIALGEQPGGDVTVAITGHAGTDLALDNTSLTFTPTNWDQRQTVTVTAGEDTDEIDDRETLIHTATAPGGVFDGVAESLWVTITDKYALRLIVTPNHLDLVEGGSGQAFEVKLGSSPSVGNGVTVAVNAGPQLNGKVSLSEPHLTFTSTDWSTDQSVTVTAESDADAADEAGTLELLASGGGYDGQNGSVSVAVDDDETAGLVVAPRLLYLEEGDSGKVVKVKLATPPARGHVRVDMNIHVRSGMVAKVSLSKSSLTFTSSDWSTYQSVTVTAKDDEDAEDEGTTLILRASGGEYQDAWSLVPIAVDDDETAQLIVAPTTLSLVEGGSGKGFSVRLDSAPVGNDVTVQVSIPSVLDGKVSLTVPHLTFTSSNWSVDQEVEVTAWDDGDIDDEAGTLDLSASGGGYDGQTGNVAVTVDDDDTVQLVVAPTTLSLVEGGSGKGFSVRLGSAPVGNDVMVQVSIPSVLDGKVSLTVPHLTFTSSNWSVDQEVEVTAWDDGDIDDEAGTLDLSASGGGYDGQTGNVAVTVDDDDTVQLVVAPTTLSLVEGGSGKGFSVRLGSAPVGNDVTVQVSIPSVLDGKVSLTVPHLTFTSSNWSVDQEVEVTAKDDGDIDDEAGTLDLSASGGGYDGQTGNVAVTVDDDDTVQLVVAPTTLSLVEGGSGKGFSVRLGSAPVGNDVMVQVSIPSVLDGKVSLTVRHLTFTSSNWSTDQSVTVTAVDDGDADDEAGTLDLSASGGGYDGQTGNVAITVDDDDTVQLVVAPTTLSLVEGGSGKGFSVRLGSAPVGNDVTVQVSIPSVLDGKVSLTVRHLTFTSSNWSTDQSVTVTAVDDGDADDEAGTLDLSASGGGYDGQAGNVAITVDDDDTVQLVVAPLTVSLVEGGTGKEFKVKLGTSPPVGGDVMVAVSIPLGLAGKVSLTVPHLKFTSSNWSTDQLVTVTAENDADADGEAGTLGLAASGGGYDGINGRVSVDVTDNDTPGLVLSKPSLTIQEGGSRDYTVRLATQPTETVVISVTTHEGASLTLSPSRLTFTGSTWDTAQTVTVTAPDDDDATNESVILAHAASGGDYGSVSKDLPVMVTDDDTPRLRIEPTVLTVLEGRSDTYRVRLETKPTGTVMVSVKSNNSDVTTSATSLTFTSRDWATEQTVTVSMAEDADTDDDNAVLMHTASGGDYDSVIGAVTVTVKDNDPVAGLVVSPVYLTMTEGTEENFTVRLLTEPTQTVDVLTSPSSQGKTLSSVSNSPVFPS